MPRWWSPLLSALFAAVAGPALPAQAEAGVDSALAGQRVLYVARHQYREDHHSTATLFQNGEINAGKFDGGSALRVIDFGAGEPRVQTLLESAEGVIRDPEVSFDGRRVVFSGGPRAPAATPWGERGPRGGAVSRLPSRAGVGAPARGWLRGGGSFFSSPRDYSFGQCNRHIMANLFRMDADGANIRRIGGNTLFEGHAHVMPDGRLLYDRWEYVDRHFGPSFGLWATNPDGTGHELIYGNNAWSPGMIADARVVPGSHWLVATLGSCHDRPWGAIAILDRSRGLDGTAPLRRSWPADLSPYLDRADVVDPDHGRSGRIDAFKGLPRKYEDPYPLSSRHILCSRQLEGERMGLFLLDVDGGETLVHEEEVLGCYDPMLLAPRSQPAPVAERHDLAAAEGSFYVADVYRGVGMEAVPRGSVRRLRVVEAPVKTTWTHAAWGIDATQAPAMNWNLTNNKRVLGSVPVEEDGSVYFRAPADTFLYFQLLDERGRMLQSMRSGTLVRPGETVGCVGCHEPRQTTVPPGARPLAMSRPPRRLEPWYGPPRDFNYLTEVQPVFDRNCVSCHGAGEDPSGGLDLSGDLGLVFNTSYLELRTKSPARWRPFGADEPEPLVMAVDDGPPQVVPAYSWGSIRSWLAQGRGAGHEGVEVGGEDLDRVFTSFDVNARYS
ncbi:MAG: hypothetical protein H8E31_05725, partial [Planctomycetes bacterium]|nr:hypothetical protein [Planctomycetota bacterium]